MSETADKVLVLGLGNDILTDDAAGLFVAREVGRRLAGHANVEVHETTEMGLTLLDFMVGYHALVLVDSIQTGQAEPGFIHEIDGADLKRLPTRTPHFLGVGETLALGRQLGLTMPARVKIIAIEVEDPFTLGTEMSPTLQQALGAAVERVMKAVQELAKPRA